MFGLLPHPGPVDDQALLGGAERRTCSGMGRNTCLPSGHSMSSSPHCHPALLMPLVPNLPAPQLAITFPLGYLLQITCVRLCLHTRDNSRPAQNSA